MSTPTISERIRSVAAQLRQFEEDFQRMEQERDEARLEADAFATYREMATTALGIDPASCADDVAEAIDALKKERGEARHERDISVRDWGLVDDALDAAGVATADEDGDGLSPWARVAALAVERDELRLTLAAEQERQKECLDMLDHLITHVEDHGEDAASDSVYGDLRIIRAAMIAADEKETT